MRKKTIQSLFLTFFISFFSLSLYAQVTVKGKVTSKENPNGLAGATVEEQGTLNIVITDAEGGYTIKVKNANAVLVFNFVGMKSKTILVAGKNEVNTELEEDVSTLSDVVVTASRQPVRKMETVTAVEVVGAKQLKAIKPEGIAEAITQAPGLYVNTSQGRRGGIVTRGFPDGGNPLGGLDYTSILLDGLPSFGSTGRLPEAGFGFDLNVDKVEVVRGSAATLFGRASAAGAINVITKTGGEKLAGTVRLTRYDNVFDDGDNDLNYRVDWNINGSLTKDKLVRFNLGGWMLNDEGFKNTGYNDKGYQIRGNFDFIPNKKAKIRLYFLHGDYVFQNLTDVPADPNTMQLAPGYKNHQTLQNFKSFYDLNYTVYETWTGFASATRRVTTNGTDSIVRSIRKAMDDNNYSKNYQVGTNWFFNLGDGFSIDNKFRFQALSSGTKYSFSLPSFYRSNYVQRLLLDGDADDQDLINEFRLAKVAQTGKVKHYIQGGHFYSNTRLRPTTYSFIHTMNPSNADTLKFAPFAPPFVNAPWTGSQAYPRGSITRRGDYTEQVNSVFLGNEMKIADKLTINIGARYDWVEIDMKETKKPFDTAVVRNAKHDDWSASLGFNYLIKKNIAVYGNINKAFRAPDYTAYTSLERISYTNRTLLRVPDGINKNETIINAELGFRSSINDLSFDVGLFYTKINDRLSRIFENGIVVSKPFGENRITGAEVSVSYNPSYLRGLSIRTSVTLQNPVFTNFKISVDRGSILDTAAVPATQLNVNPNGNLYGNTLINEGNGNYSIDMNGRKLPGVPRLIWNFNALYLHKWFGLDFSSNYNADRYVDPTNILKYDNLLILNGGVFIRIPAKGKKEMRLGIQSKNITNNVSIQNIAGLQASDITLGQKQRTPNWSLNKIAPPGAGNTTIWAQGYVQLPRRTLVYLSFDF